MEKVNEVLNFMQIAQSLGPQGQLFINQEKAIDFIAENLGIPAELRTTAEERQAIIQQATEVAQQSGMMNEQQPSEQDQVDQQ